MGNLKIQVSNNQKTITRIAQDIVYNTPFN
jgi:hypothetical protein